jgi:hypothetical protein
LLVKCRLDRKGIRGKGSGGVVLSVYRPYLKPVGARWYIGVFYITLFGLVPCLVKPCQLVYKLLLTGRRKIDTGELQG